MGKCAVICVGKIRADYWRAACGHYLRLLEHWRQVMVIEVRDGGAGGIAREGEQILSKIPPRDFPIALDASGRAMTSPQFAQLLRQCDEVEMKRPAFIIGGPWGLDESVLKHCSLHLSLSPMIFTHELARVLLLEQIYRAESILRGSPYHHG